MAATSIANPQMPLLAPIPGGFMHGKIIRIQGSLSPNAQRFAVNLQCGPNTNPRDDLALHLNARIHERVVVRNSLISGHWGQEERHGSMFPFVPGQGFEILLLAESHNYKIAINGQHFAEFRSRTPMERVSYISADGEIMISMINFEGGAHGMPGHAPMPMAPMPMPMPGMPQHGHQQYPAPGMPHQHYPAPGMPHQPYPAPGMYPTQPGMGYPTQPGMHPAQYGHLSPKSAKKAAKKQAKAQKKALKYGIPLAAVGVGAYGLHHGMKHHHGYHGHSSSSSSSSSE